jgi:Spy/CpxP family protein refolding chaperone
MRVLSAVLALAVSLVLAGGVLADDKVRKKANKEGPAIEDSARPGRPGMDRGELFARMLKGIDLSDEQKGKIEELKKEYAPKFKDAWQTTDAVLTDEQKQARTEAMKAARAAGKKGPEVREDIQAAMKLTGEQKAKLQAAREAGQALRKEAMDKVKAILTPEQLEKLKADRPRHGDRKKAEGQ